MSDTMQNRSLIYIVCVVAIASLTLLFIADQGFVQPDPRSGLRNAVAKDSHHRLRKPSGVRGHDLSDERLLPNQGHSPTREQSGNHSPSPLGGNRFALKSEPHAEKAPPVPDGWSRIHDRPSTHEVMGMSWPDPEESAEREPPEDAVGSSAARATKNLEDHTVDSGKDSLIQGNSATFESVAARSIAERRAATFTDTPAGFVTSVSDTATPASTASMIDRPASRSTSGIMQVQNQEPATAETEEDAEAQQMGVPPPKRTPAFLKKKSLLLEPGQYQFEYGLRYSVDNNSYAIAGLLQEGTTTVQVVNANQKRQLVSSPLEMRFGIQDNLQGFVTLPIGWSAQSLTASGSQSESDIFGIGDLGIGLTRVLWAPDNAKTRFLGFLQASAPIGGGEISLSQQDRDASLGAGYWTLTAGGNITESIDPLILFGSFGYTHTFGTRIPSGNYVDVGNTIFYQVGVGYGINPFVTLSGSFSGASSGRIRLDDNIAAGTRSEPFSLRLSASVNKPNDGEKSKLGTNYEPFLRFGLTGLANDVEFGIRWTY